MSRILPSTLTDEEILALLDSEDVEEEVLQVFEYDDVDDIVPFLTFYNITPGTTPVSKRLLHKLYKLHSKDPIELNFFNIQVGRFVPIVGANFLLNMDNFAISSHIYKAEKTRDKTKSLTYQKHFQWFLETRGIESGNVWIEGFILFFIYKDFCKSRRVNTKLGYVNFHKFLKLHLPYRRIKGNRALFFRVNKETATIFSKDDCDKIRAARTTKETRGSKKAGEPEAAPTA
jgi:hypothetical protein